MRILDKQLKKLFAALEKPAPEEKLRLTILNMVNRHEWVLNMRLAAVYSTAAAISALAVIPSVRALAEAVSQSDFIQFISLFFTDADVVASHWQTFALSIIEALPVAELAIMLSIVLVLLWSVEAIKRIQFKTA